MASMMRREFASRGVAQMAATYFGPSALNPELTKPPANLHGRICRLLEDPKNRDVAIVAPRSSGKSAWIRWFVIWSILFNPEAVHFIYAQNDLTVGRKNLYAIRQQIEGNELLIRDFGELWHPDRWGKTEIGIFKPDAANMALPIGQRRYALVAAVSPRQKSGLRGTHHMAKRPQFAILDDPELDEQHRITEDASAFGYWAFAKLFPAMDPDVGRRIWIGNMSAEETMLAQIMEGVPFTANDGKEYDHPKTGDRKKHSIWKRIKVDAIQPDDSSYWEAGAPREWLRAKEIEYENMGLGHLFSAEFRNRPTNPKTALFRREWFSPPFAYGKAPRNAAEILRRWPDAVIIGAVDPAISESTTADYFAIATLVLVTTDVTREVYVADVEWDRLPFPDQVEHLYALYDVWRWHVLVVEKQAYQLALAQQMEALAGIKKKDITVEPVTVPGAQPGDTGGHGTRKHLRFVAMAPRVKSSILRFAEDRPEIANIFVTYRKGKTKDDVLDAVEMGSRYALQMGEEAAEASPGSGESLTEREERLARYREKMFGKRVGASSAYDPWAIVPNLPPGRRRGPRRRA